VWRRGHIGWVSWRKDRCLEADEQIGAHDQLPPARAAPSLGQPVIGPAQFILGVFETVLGSCVRSPYVLLMCPTVRSILPGRLVMRCQVVSGGRWTGSVVSTEERVGVRWPKTNAHMERCAVVPAVKTRAKGRQRVWRTRSPGNVQTTWWERIATTDGKPKRCKAWVSSQLSPYRLSGSPGEHHREGKAQRGQLLDQLDRQLRLALVDIARLEAAARLVEAEGEGKGDGVEHTVVIDGHDPVGQGMHIADIADVLTGRVIRRLAFLAIAWLTRSRQCRE